MWAGWRSTVFFFAGTEDDAPKSLSRAPRFLESVLLTFLGTEIGSTSLLAALSWMGLLSNTSCCAWDASLPGSDSGMRAGRRFGECFLDAAMANAASAALDEPASRLGGGRCGLVRISNCSSASLAAMLREGVEALWRCTSASKAARCCSSSDVSFGDADFALCGSDTTAGSDSKAPVCD